MMEAAEQVYYVAVAGALPEDAGRAEQLLNTVEACFQQVDGGGAHAEWLLAPSYSSPGWFDLARRRSAVCHIVHRACDSVVPDEGWTQTEANTKLRMFEEQWLCANADVLVVAWNEQPGELDGATWALLSRAHSERIPCIWLSSSSGSAYWPMENYYELFEREGFIRLLKKWYSASEERESGGDAYRRILRLGDRLQRRFFKRHAAAPSAGEATSDTAIESGGEGEVQRQLVERFRGYDGKAIDYGARYRAIMYWRAVLPTLAAAFLALGFYAGDLPGIISTIAKWFAPSAPLARWLPSAGLDFACHALSAVGFLINAVILFYAYRMSSADEFKRWHRAFVNNRQIAEIYRVLAHFEPYGISVNLKRVCAENPHALTVVRRELRRIGLHDVCIDEATSNKLLDRLEELLKDQLSYHERSVRRYEALTTWLRKWAVRLKNVSFIWLLVRGGMQFLIGLGLIGQGDKTGTIANMLAMMLPAAATYFASKDEQCQYSFLLENHCAMKKAIADELERICEIRDSAAAPSAEMLVSIAETISTLMIVDDTANWHKQISKAGFSQL